MNRVRSVPWLALFAALALAILSGCALEPGIGPTGIALNSSGTRLYVAGGYGIHPGARAVWVVDTQSPRVISTVAMPHFPASVAVHPNGTRVYVTIEPVQNELHVLDATTLRTLARIPLPIPPSSGLAFDPSAELLYVGGKSGINVVELQTNTIVATIPTAGTASHLIVNPESGEIIATVHLGLPGRSQLLVVDPRDRSQTAVTVEGIPSGIALSYQLLLVATFDRSIGRRERQARVGFSSFTLEAEIFSLPFL